MQLVWSRDTVSCLISTDAIVDIAIISNVENGLGITAASLVTLLPLLRHIVEGRRKWCTTKIGNSHFHRLDDLVGSEEFLRLDSAHEFGPTIE